MMQTLEKIEIEPNGLIWNMSTVHTIKFLMVQNLKHDQTKIRKHTAYAD